MKYLGALMVWLWMALGVQAQDVGVWGWRGEAWKTILQDRFGVQAEVINEPDGRVPVEEFHRFKLVIIGQGRPAALTDEQHSAVRKYLEDGGVVLVDTIAIAGLVASETRFDLTPGEGWIGGTLYSYGAVDAEVMEPEHPALKHLSGKVPEWFRSPTGIRKLTTAKPLIGVGDNARVLVNRVGKGGFIYIAPEATEKTLKPDGEDAELLWEMVRVFIDAALAGGAKLEAVLGEPVQGAQAKHQGRQREIVLQVGDDAKEAAAELGRVIQKSQGVILKRMKEEAPGNGALVIHVGQTPYVKGLNLDFDSLHPYGYFIRLVDDHNLVISGKLKGGNQYAAVDFLKRFAGYRYLGPGPGGEVIPSATALELPKTVDIKSQPDILSFTNAGFWGGKGDFSRSWRTTLKATHVLGKIISPAKYGESNPDYFPMYKGKRFIPDAKLGGTWQPCVSHPDLPKVTIAWAKEFFEKDPTALGFPVGVNDGGGECQCPECDAARRKYGNSYIPFYNEVARLAKEAFPGKYVCFIAYGAAVEAPKGIKLEDNLLVEVASGLANNHEPLKKWKAAGARHIGLYDYLYGGGFVVPRHYPRLMAEQWRQMKKEYGMASAWTESFIENWEYDGPRQYVINELAWNLDANVDTLLSEYFSLYYGSAGATMGKLFDRFEEIYLRSNDPLFPIGGWKQPQQFDGYTVDDLTWISDQLAKAKSEAGSGLPAERVQRFADLWRLSEAYIETRLSLKALAKIPAEGVHWIAPAASGYAALAKIAGYSLSPEQEKAIFNHKGLKEYKGFETLDMRPALDATVDAHLKKIDRHLEENGVGGEKLVAFWEKRLKAELPQEVRFLVESHLAEKQGEKRNLFALKEPADKGSPSEKDWDAADKRLPGWLTWNFPRSVTEFSVVEDKELESRHAMRIGRNDIKACYLRDFRVQPGGRYRVRFKVRQNAGAKPTSVMVRWKGAEGFLKANNERPHGPLTIPCPEPNGKWQEVSVAFTAPLEATTGALLLQGAPRQLEGEETSFGDVELYKIPLQIVDASAVKKKAL